MLWRSWRVCGTLPYPCSLSYCATILFHSSARPPAAALTKPVGGLLVLQISNSAVSETCGLELQLKVTVTVLVVRNPRRAGDIVHSWVSMALSAFELRDVITERVNVFILIPFRIRPLLSIHLCLRSSCIRPSYFTLYPSALGKVVVESA
ncbi:hypothetical protein C8R45DRAFT_1091142 [Mycena sanguinolenta]|nr:hypothetical protein C8R45DRAFT_1091142 [Mycena sanguinolenta]